MAAKNLVLKVCYIITRRYLRQPNVKLISLNMQNHQRLLIIDFGSQVTQLIARRLRELSIYCEIHPFQNVTEKFLQEFKAEAIILSGGPSSITDENSPRPPNLVFELDIPVLGICYGQQVMMAMLGGHVDKGIGTAEFGRAILHKTDRETPLLEGGFQQIKNKYG